MTLAPPSSDISSLLTELEVELPRWQVPGVQVAVVRDGAVLFAGGVGVRDVTTNAPVTAQTMFDHGSCGKAYTGLLAALLHEDGGLDLDAPVRRYVPELELPDPVLAERVTTRDLLSHRSGLARHDLSWVFNSAWTTEELVRRLAHLPVSGDLRAKMTYSNIGYALAGLAIERATGSSWHKQVRERVLQPIGMRQTTTVPDVFLAAEDRSTPHMLADDAVVPTAYRVSESIAPAGQVMPSAEDAARWLLVHTGHDVVNQNAVQATHRLHTPMAADLAPHPLMEVGGYGMGWVTLRYRDQPMLMHAGGVDGFRTDIVVLPRQRIGVLVSANIFPSTLPFAAALQIVDRLLGHSDVSWYDDVRETGAPKPDAEAAAAVEAPAIAGPPTHPVGEYVGVYKNPGYGELVVTAEAGDLQIRIGDSDLSTTHRHFDTWNAHYALLALDLTVTFIVDAEGLVGEAVVPLDEGGPTRFGRVSPGGPSS
jgi:CubicO group peptidase (beta-lactamase class C family)